MDIKKGKLKILFAGALMLVSCGGAFIAFSDHLGRTISEVLIESAWTTALSQKENDSVFEFPKAAVSLNSLQRERNSHKQTQSSSRTGGQAALNSLVLAGISGQVVAPTEVVFLTADSATSEETTKHLAVGDQIALPFGKRESRIYKVVALKTDKQTVCGNASGVYSDAELMNCGPSQHLDQKVVRYIIELVPLFEQGRTQFKSSQDHQQKL